MEAFAETRLELGYDYGAEGGPEWQTTIAETGAGFEQRNVDWQEDRGKWQLGERGVSGEKLAYLIDFFNARRGRAQGFRWRDWGDWRADAEPLDPDGSPTVQLAKTYADGGVAYTKPIRKPVDGTVTLTRGGATYTPAGIDPTTGVVTLAADATASISDVTAAAPAVVTATGHGYSSGDTIWITGTGLAAIDDQTWTITVVDTDTFELDGSDTTGTGGAGSGSAEKYVQPGESLTWLGEYDKPVRFDTDRFDHRFDARDPDRDVDIFYITSLPVIEVRV